MVFKKKMINIRDKYIFTHVEKTAGTSMAFELQKNHLGYIYYIATNFADRDRKGTLQLAPLEEMKDNYPNKHIELEGFKPFMPEHEWDQFFKFAFVRNPLDRLVSLYVHIVSTYFKTEGRITAQDILTRKPEIIFEMPNLDGSGILTHYEVTFDFFARHFSNRGLHGQVKQLSDQKGNIITNFTGKFETLEADWKKVCEKIKIAPNLPKKNMSEGTKGLYKQFYTDDLKEFIYDRDSEDFERLGYEKI
jgi:hypothetical protein|tara:strand:- start:349 stop:1092 length:744 start_codon:yes stop_codon:yes gene_type:complete